MLKLDGVRYSIDDKVILKGISGRFEPCKIHGIVGPNGSGKSTLLKNICRIWEPEDGRILIDDRDAKTFSRRELSRTVTLVPQNTSIGFPISVYDMVTMGRNPHLGRFQPMRRRDREIIDWALENLPGRHLLSSSFGIQAAIGGFLLLNKQLFTPNAAAAK